MLKNSSVETLLYLKGKYFPDSQERSNYAVFAMPLLLLQILDFSLGRMNMCSLGFTISSSQVTFYSGDKSPGLIFLRVINMQWHTLTTERRHTPFLTGKITAHVSNDACHKSDHQLCLAPHCNCIHIGSVLL